VLLWSGVSVVGLVAILLIALTIYSSTAYEASPDMYDAMETYTNVSVERYEDRDQISFYSTLPRKNVVIIPGGLVEADAYEYLALRIALMGYDVTIWKTPFHLAILAPNYAKRFLSDDMDNIIIGHSLGGTVASMIASKDDRVNGLVLLGSYPIRDVSSIEVMVITGEFDEILDQADLENSYDLLPEDVQERVVIGGNHGYFGWYGEQDGDGVAEISNETQQNQVFIDILIFLQDW
jgi:hypothetical protein